MHHVYIKIAMEREQLFSINVTILIFIGVQGTLLESLMMMSECFKIWSII